MASSLPFLVFIFLQAFCLAQSKYPSSYHYKSDPNPGKEQKEVLDPSLTRRDYRNMGYSTVGPIYERANKLQMEIKQGANKPYGTVLRVDITDAKLLGQKSITFVQQLLGAVVVPPRFVSLFPKDVVSRANNFRDELALRDIGASGNYMGMEVVRKAVAEFIGNRDGIFPNFTNVILTNGVCEGFEVVSKLLQFECDGDVIGILTPRPAYTLYTAILTEHGMKPIFFPIKQENNWEFEIPLMEQALRNSRATCNCRPRAFLLTNPGMPWGTVQTEEKLREIIKLAYDHQLLIIADEILQDSVSEDINFISARKIMLEMPFPYNQTEMINLHSVSKGYMGESGLRGGYMELVNISPKINEIVANFKSVKMNPNQAGQAALYSYVNPPQRGEVSYPLFNKQKYGIIGTQQTMGNRLIKGLNQIEGVTCSEIEGGLVAFANITVPPRAVSAARSEGVNPDVFYALQLLEETGIAVTSGTAFNMLPEEPFLRMVVPAKESDLQRILENFEAFNSRFLKKYNN